MPVQISEDTTALRAKEKPIKIPVNPNEESVGTVELVLCELPAGLLEELEGEIRELAESIFETNKNLSSARRQQFELEAQAAMAFPEAREGILAQCSDALTRCQDLREQRQEYKAERRGKQLQIIAWGVCNHNPADFLSGTKEIEFKPEIAVYDGLQYRVASKATIRQYLSVGTEFIDCLYVYVTNFQRQVVLSPRKVWDETKKNRLRIEQKIEALLQRELEAEVRNATDQTPEDRLAEAGGELGAEEPDPNGKRTLAKATIES